MAKKKKTKKPKLERSYNIPLRKKFRHTAKHKKTPKAMRTIREFLVKHMKTESGKIKLGMHLNEHLWKHGIRNPPHHVKVHAVKEEDVVKAEFEGFKFKEAVKSEKKKEPTTMKEKLVAKLGVKEGAKPDEKTDKKPEEKVEEKKEEVKKPETKAEAKPKVEPKPEPKPPTPAKK